MNYISFATASIYLAEATSSPIPDILAAKACSNISVSKADNLLSSVTFLNPSTVLTTSAFALPLIKIALTNNLPFKSSVPITFLSAFIPLVNPLILI